MTKPVKNKNAVVTSGYGVRTLDGKKEFHGGLDISVPGNPQHVPIYSTMSGVITAIIYDANASCGKAVFVKPDKSDFYCLYFHLDYINADLFVDEHIEEGQYIGGMGYTGRCIPPNKNGTHLHYGHRKGMESGTETLDPQEVRGMYK